MTWEYSLAGLLVGGLVGLTGMGGGSLMAPLLIVVLGVPALPAVGSGLIFSSLTKIIGGWEHARLRTVDYRLSAYLALGSVPASVVGAYLFTRLIHTSAAVETLLTKVMGVVLLLVAVTLLLRPWLGTPGRLAGAGRPPRWLLASGGAVVGAMAGITSVGSGTLTTALLSMTTREQGQKVVGTVVFHAMLLTFAAGLTHLTLGEVNLALTAALLLGSIPGVVIGSRITTIVPEAKLRDGLAYVLLFLSLVILMPTEPGPRRAEAADAASTPAGAREARGEAPYAASPADGDSATERTLRP